MIRHFMAIGLSLALVFAACSGGDSETDGDEGDDDPPATQAANDPNGGGDNDGDDSDSDDEDGGEDDGGDDSDFHACSLFTGAELGEALGVEMGDGRDYLATARGATNCTWEGDVVVFVEVLLDGGQDWYDAIHLPDANGEDTEEVAGLGDVAIWDNFLNALDVVEGDRFISVQTIVIFSDKDGREIAMTVAQLALERLP